MKTTHKSIRQQVSHEYQFNNNKALKHALLGYRVLGLLIILASIALGMFFTSIGDERSDGTMAVFPLALGLYLMFGKFNDDSKEMK